MTKPTYPKGQFLTLNAMAIVYIMFIVIDDLTHLKKICMIIQLCMQWDSLAKTSYVRMANYSINFVPFL